MTNAQKDDIHNVMTRLRGESIRHDHNLAESYILGNWFDVNRQWLARQELLRQAGSLEVALRNAA